MYLATSGDLHRHDMTRHDMTSHESRRIMNHCALDGNGHDMTPRFDDVLYWVLGTDSSPSVTQVKT